MRRLPGSALLFDARTFPSDAALAWRMDGAMGVWKEISARTIQRMVLRARPIVVEQDFARFVRMAPPPGVRVQLLTDHDWPALATIATQRTLERFRRAAANGRRGIVAWKDDRPIGYNWCSERMDAAIEIFPLPLPADATYHWASYVVPWERRTGVGSALVNHQLEYARTRGFRRSWRVIAVSNHASLRTVERAAGGGTRIVGELAYLSVLGRTIARFVPAEAGGANAPGPSGETLRAR
ncbi:MAG TPA: GNAT family N-acetyltransferase [Gemmatimonadaceae bacterium]|nr:GNAT family N-acetyltransferase [Gemmatimonadaceae bacterium]